MSTSRRQFLGSIPVIAAATSLLAGQQLAAAETKKQISGSDPLNVRGDFPVTQELVYLDGAFITPSPQQAVDASIAFTQAKATNPVSLGGMMQVATSARKNFAQLVGADIEECGLLYATSDGENIVTHALDLQPGDNVVVDDLHYDTTYLLYQNLVKTNGIEIRRVTSVNGVSSVESFAKLVDDKTRIVSVSWISHKNGYRHDLKALAELAHEHGAYLYADAIQGLGMLDLDVRDTGIDFFAAGTYKWLLGGYGVAPFYVRKELLETITPDRFGDLAVAEKDNQYNYRIHADARKYGYATMGFGAVYQLNAALEYLLQVGVANIERHTVALAHKYRAGLVSQGFSPWTPEGNQSAIVTFNHGMDVTRVRDDFKNAGVKVSFKEGGIQLRAGIALFNNEEDIDALLAVSEKWI
jgi:selenocysteine lyase/cysteine desulfurase